MLDITLQKEMNQKCISSITYDEIGNGLSLKHRYFL